MLNETLIQNINNYIVIDLRSPKEYTKGHIKGAINIPLLDDEARHLIGKLYKQDKEQAYQEGYKIGNQLLPGIYDQIKELILSNPGLKIVCYCFRGGMRSTKVVEALNNLGVECIKLEGGYKEYRQYVLTTLEQLIPKFNYYVVTGNTGSGKTNVLLGLKEQGYPIIDLEGLAKHRGSVFGKVGIADAISQSNFEDELFYVLREYYEAGSNNVFLESESRKIGSITIPNQLYHLMKKSKHILLNVSVKARGIIIKETYDVDNLEKVAIKSIIMNNHCFKNKLGSAWVSEMINLIEDDNYDLFIEKMLVDYYDKLYANSQDEYKYDLVITADDQTLIINKLIEYYNKL